MAANSATLRTIRQLLSEIRKASAQKKIRDLAMTRYVMSECRRYQTTDQQNCKARAEVEYMANTYLCHLKSMRRYNEINTVYKGRGERTIEDTAKLVGFKLPHDKK